MSLFNNKWILSLVIGVITFAVYSFKLPALFDGMDDQVLIVGNTAVQHPGTLREIFTKPFFVGGNYYRPGVLLSYMLEFKLFGLDAFFYSLTNIILHIINSLLVFVLAQYFTKGRISAFFVSLLFAVHPINWEAVAMISGRPILLCVLFFLAGLIAYLKSFSGKAVWYVAALFSFTLGLLCKEEMVIFPVILAVYEWLWGRGNKEQFRQTALRLWSYGALLAGYFVLRSLIHVAPISAWSNFSAVIKAVATFIWGLVVYLKTFLLPVDIYYDRSIKYIIDYADVRFGLAILVLIACVSWFCSKWYSLSRQVKFFLLWIVLTLLPVSQIIPINVQIGSASIPNHFFYLSSIAIFVITILALSKLYHRLNDNLILAPVCRVLFGTGIIFCMFITVKQNVIAAQPLGVFQQTLYYEPDNLRVRHGIALHYALNRQWSDAERQFRTVLRFDPSNIGARISLGRVLFEQKRCEEARDEFNKIQNAGPFQDVLNRNKQALGTCGE